MPVKLQRLLTIHKALKHPMPRLPLILFAAGLSALLALAACSPTFNWREVRPENTRLSLLLPCKPDKAQRVVPFAGKPTALSMLGCDAGGVTFAVAVVDLGNPGEASNAAAILAQWQSLTLANMKAGAAQVSPLPLPGTAMAQPAVLVKAQGQRADGTAVTGQAAYFAHGSQLFQVVMYAGKVPPEVAETYFSSLKFE